MTTLSYNQNMKVQPILTAADIVATATATAYTKIGDAAGPIEVCVTFGSIASTDSTGEVVVTVECSKAASSNATELPVGGYYRLSGAVNTDSMGALTSFTGAAGAVVNNTDDNKVLSIFIEPATIATLGADYLYLRAVVTPTSEITATVVGAHIRYPSRYAGNSIASST